MLVNIVDGFLMLTCPDGKRVALKGSAIIAVQEGDNSEGSKLLTTGGVIFEVKEELGEIGAAVTRSYKQVMR